jgi:precorrin-4/cobalt-precorrin-4 C11-methyltransferase
LTHNEFKTGHGHPVLFVGAGPGDPELITVKGQKALAAADLVVYAGSLVPEDLLTWVRADATVKNSAGMDLNEIVNVMESAFRTGGRVVRLHTGDPSLYGAVFEQMTALRQRGIPYRVVPGITAAFAAAATLGIEYTLPEVTQTLILTRMEGRTAVPQSENLASLAAHRASMAIYLSIHLVEQVAKALSKAYGPEAPCVVAYRVSQPQERMLFTTLEELPRTVERHQITRQALIIVGKILDTAVHGTRSKLYDETFSHGFRK